MGGGSARRAVVLASCVTAFLSVTVAEAGTTIDTGSINRGVSNGLVYVRATSEPVGTGESRGAAAECGGNKMTTGGGATVQGAASPIDDSAPIPGFSARRFWVGTFTNEAGGQTVVHADAICGRLSGRELETKTVKDAPADTEVALRARCPRGTQVTGGGVRFSGDASQSRVSAPFDSGDKGGRPDDGWKVVGYPATVADVGVVALCARDVSLAYRFDTIGPFPGTTTATAQALCKEGHALAGGGGTVGGASPANRITYLGPHDHFTDQDDVPDDRWDVGVGLEAGQTATAVAICKK